MCADIREKILGTNLCLKVKNFQHCKKTKIRRYPSVFHGRILYYDIFIIQLSFTAEQYMLVTGDI